MDIENAKIEYIKIVEGLQAQFNAVLNYIAAHESDYDTNTYKELKLIKNIIVSDEQHFVKMKDLDANNLYVVVKFGSATINMASAVLAITLKVMGSENRIKPTQLILGEFVTTYNLNLLNDDTTMTQVWYTPTVASNFNPTNSAFRSLFNVTGIVVVGQNTLDLETLVYIDDNGDEEVVAVMSFDEGYQASSNPQPFGNSLGFAKTEIDFGTDAITFSTYLLDSQLVADCMSARGMTKDSSEDGHQSTKEMNDIFKFKIKYTNGFENAITKLKEYKLLNYRIGKKIGDIPSFTASFSY